MCGRFVLTASVETLVSVFGLTQNIVLKPRYNITPSNVIPAIRKAGVIEFLSWGLKPKWLKEGQSPFINARMETLQEKPAFRNAFKKQRCLIVADGYYEWKQVGRIKQPYFISLPQREVFAFAGLWDGDTCAVITKAAISAELSSIHDRMPVILSPEHFTPWLDLKTDVLNLEQCMLNPRLGALQIFPVSTKVNNPKNDFPACITPLH